MRIRRVAVSVRPNGPVSNDSLNGNRWAGLRPAVRRGAIAVLAASVAVMGWATYVFSAPAFQDAPSVTVTPSEVYTGDTIEITLDGLSPGFGITGGSVTLAGKRLAVPGTFGAAGTQPITDASGEVSFTTKVPLEMPYGSNELMVSNLPVGESRITTLKVLAVEITFSPNETVTLRGLGFSPSTSPGGKGPLGVHQITGEGKSGIKVNGKLLGAPYVRYPIDLDSDGGLTATIILPESYVTAPGSGLEVKGHRRCRKVGMGPVERQEPVHNSYSR